MDDQPVQPRSQVLNETLSQGLLSSSTAPLTQPTQLPPKPAKHIVKWEEFLELHNNVQGFSSEYAERFELLLGKPDIAVRQQQEIKIA